MRQNLCRKMCFEDFQDILKCNTSQQSPPSVCVFLSFDHTDFIACVDNTGHPDSSSQNFQVLTNRNCNCSLRL